LKLSASISAKMPSRPIQQWLKEYKVGILT
jgi:hypothetical protein